MSEGTTISSLKDLLRFPFRDAEWRRPFLIGSALLLAGYIIPVIPALFVYGYIVQVMRRAIQGEEPSLPAWDEWGKLAVDGLRACAVSLIYLLPGAIVAIAGVVGYFVGIYAMVLSSEQGGGDMAAALGMPLLIGALFLAMFLSMLLTLLGLVPWPMATAHFVAQDRIGAALHVREWLPLLRRNKFNYFIAWIIMAGLAFLIYWGLLLAYYTLILCIVIPVVAAPLSFYLLLIGAALFGQTYRESQIQLRGES